MWAEKTVADL